MRRGDVSLRDVTIAQMGNGARECEWHHALEARGGFWEFWRKLVELSSASGEDGWLSLACWSQASGLVAGATGVAGADGKVIIERLCISLPYVETFNSKGNKRFRTWTKWLHVFHDSEFLCSMYIHYEHPMYVSHISISWVWYNKSFICTEFKCQTVLFGR